MTLNGTEGELLGQSEGRLVSFLQGMSKVVADSHLSVSHVIQNVWP